MGEINQPSLQSPKKEWINWITLLLLAVILLVGAYFRFTGLDWDQNQHLHPDERFLTMVESAIDPVKDFAQYFDTANSPLNPNNRGYGFYVYGDLPLIGVRYIGQWLNQTGYDAIHLVGRGASAAVDLATVLVVFLIAERLYRRRWLSLLAAAFAACSVLPIQLSHYFTVDTFTNFFGMLAMFFAVWILPRGSLLPEITRQPHGRGGIRRIITGSWASAVPFILFGAVLGMAMSSKINAVFLAALLPAAALIRWISLPVNDRREWAGIYVRNLIAAGLVSLVVFRICQPYAFSGPGFFGFLPNSKWIDQLRELANQSAGDVDFPPALQWARRPLTFAWTNMVTWGLGLPLGLLAWAGFLWMAYRIFKGEWRQHLLIWGWTGGYFVYQSINWVRTMRYQMLVYPTLAIIAAWAVIALWDKRPSDSPGWLRRAAWTRSAAVVLGLGVVMLTAAWAFAFTRIYTRPVTRVEASRWIYTHVPGPINLHIQTAAGETNVPAAFRSGYTLQPGTPPLVMAFRPRQEGQIVNVSFEFIGSPDNDLETKTLAVGLSRTPDGSSRMARARLDGPFPNQDDPRGMSYTAGFDLPVTVYPDQTYYLVMSQSQGSHGLALSGAITLSISSGQTRVRQNLPEPVNALSAGTGYEMVVNPPAGGILDAVVLEHVVDWEGRADTKTLRVTIFDPATGTSLSTAELTHAFTARTDVRGERYSFKLSQPVQIRAGASYGVRLEQVNGPARLAVYGSKQANESSWDDALPVSLDGYNPYDYATGIYRSDLNFEMYWDDNPDKLQRFESILDQADLIYISSNRQWGTTVRVPERYPLTTAFYRALIGCPYGQEIITCYSTAQPGQFQGKLGFELAAVFQSNPNLGPVQINDQFAEEAFTVYDHPKVLIFKKTAGYDSARVRALLEAVDLTNVMHLTPRKAGPLPGDLLLPPDRSAGQQAGGTWAELFHPDAWYNRFPILGAVIWYLALTGLGWAVFPFTRLALRGLPDRGYPLVRLVGLLALAYGAWLLGSIGVPFTAGTISLVFAGLLGINLGLAYRQRKILALELRERRNAILVVEGLLLFLFILFLAIRIGNPDLWHAFKGGEKPMDFAYFNAVLKSTTFPPYDPWFAGGYINYYYYGFVIVGVLVKWLGIIPAIAYNLILPTLLALTAIGAYSVGSNLWTAAQPRFWAGRMPVFGDASIFARQGNFFAGLSAALGVTILGNLGTVRMIWWGLQKLADMQVPFDKASMITRIGWAATGLFRLVTEPGTRLAYGPGDWYWIPSRASVGWDITEFPAFTFLYGDPHAHLIALPVTVLALAWGLSVLLGRWGWKGWGHLGASFLLGSLTIGALRPTNTWDWPTYLGLGLVAVLYTALRYGQACCLKIPKAGPKLKRIIIAAAAVLGLAVLSTLLYQPFTLWYGQGYTSFDRWTGYHVPFWSYLTHWGVFLFMIISWMVWETKDWWSITPPETRHSLRRFWWIFQLGLVILTGLVVILMVGGISIAWLVLPLLVWAGMLLFKPGFPDAKRAVLFMVGTGLFLTLLVELVVLRGDLDRMNTIFKFYLQAWVLLALSAGVSLVWLLPVAGQAWRSAGWVWKSAAGALILGAALFPVMAAPDKISDRMNPSAPHTLDGMAYMASASYTINGQSLDLGQDYRAIEWVQRHVAGSPVIVEANTPEYQWGSRFSIYTGLPSVIGWNWHQRQQRAVTPDTWIYDRIGAVEAFYNTTSQTEAENFLRRYGVKYIIVGQLERTRYAPAGIQKFEDWTGHLWQLAYQDKQTAIYAVSVMDQ